MNPPVLVGDAVGPSVADPLVGRDLLGTYRLVEPLGKGGMATVYRGRHLLTDQEVAIKILSPELATQSDVKARFIDEARTLARLEHPNIVTLYNFLEAEGHLYLVMQIAEGEALDALIGRQGRLPCNDVVAIGIETLFALEYAHERGVVHRDIKPSNIVIRGDGAVKVMDFGIAKIVGSTKLTQTGQTMGTVRYMAPEQVRGKPVDHRCDLYALGVTLYEACSGQPPFDGDTHFEIMRKQLVDAPRPLSELAAVPPELEQTLARAMEKRAEDRFANAREYIRALKAVPVGPPSGRVTSSAGVAVFEGPATIAVASARRRRPSAGRDLRQVMIALALIALSVGAILWGVLSDPPARAPARHGAPARSAASVVWPPLHAVARGLRWSVDERKGDLHLLAQAPVDVAALEALCSGAHRAYVAFLRREGIDLPVPRRPLHLVLLPRALFAAHQSWSSPRYEAMSSTLYISTARPDFQRSDLPHGLALHYCAVLAQLSNERCLELAEGFEREVQRAGR
ncbi:MAG: serine/threonine protein kinase [Proteobacteria bacterium]|nr:serine/threonine protein kinase [Pseudomonadota bacterium]